MSSMNQTYYLRQLITKMENVVTAIENNDVTFPESMDVNVSNFPATQPVSGTVSISGSHPVTVTSGSITATCSGTVAVTNSGLGKLDNALNLTANNYESTTSYHLLTAGVKNEGGTILQSNDNDFCPQAMTMQGHAFTCLGSVGIPNAAVATDSGSANTGCLRVVIADDDTNMKELYDCIDHVNKHVEVDTNAINGTAMAVNNGVLSAGVQRVCIANNDHISTSLQVLNRIELPWDGLTYTKRKYFKVGGFCNYVTSGWHGIPEPSDMNDWVTKASLFPVVATASFSLRNIHASDNGKDITITYMLQDGTTNTLVTTLVNPSTWVSNIIFASSSTGPRSIISIECEDENVGTVVVGFSSAGSSLGYETFSGLLPAGHRRTKNQLVACIPYNSRYRCVNIYAQSVGEFCKFQINEIHYDAVNDVRSYRVLQEFCLANNTIAQNIDLRSLGWFSGPSISDHYMGICVITTSLGGSPGQNTALLDIEVEW